MDDFNPPPPPKAIRLPKAYPPSRVMEDPVALRLRVIDYFSLLEAERSHPTPPGLAMAMGLRGFDALMRILKEVEEEPITYPEEALDVLYTARSYLEDYYIRYGLKEAIPAAFTKFLLTAFFNRSEKTIQETLNAKDNNLQINILGVSEPMILDGRPQPPIPTAIEQPDPQEVLQKPNHDTLTISYTNPPSQHLSYDTVYDSELEDL